MGRLIDEDNVISSICLFCDRWDCDYNCLKVQEIRKIPTAKLERKWNLFIYPPKHHNDVLVKGIDAFNNKTIYKVMHCDVNGWQPETYSSSIKWKEWCEI